jgi:WD40 repeat protein
LAAGCLGFRLDLWDVAKGELLWKTRAHRDSISSTAFSPDGETLAVGGDYDSPVVLWDVPSRTERLTLDAHSDSIRGVAFSPDGRRLATASRDGTVKLWGPADGRLLATLFLLPTTGEEPSREWITYTPDSVYDSSPGAAHFIRWSIDGELHEVSVCEREFHHPERLAAALR